MSAQSQFARGLSETISGAAIELFVTIMLTQDYGLSESFAWVLPICLVIITILFVFEDLKSLSSHSFFFTLGAILGAFII